MKKKVLLGIASVAVALMVVPGGMITEKSVIAQGKPHPIFEVDWRFPRTPDGTMLGAVGGVAADRMGNVWAIQRPHTIPEYNAALNGTKPLPSVIQFDKTGKYLQGFGGPAPSGEYQWFYRSGNLRSAYAPCPGCGTEVRGNGDHRASNGEHGIFVDHQDNVWVTGNASRDGQILKFDNKGKFLKQFGKVLPDGFVDSAATTHVSRAAGLVVNPRTNELFVSDGYGNRRVLVLDATTLAYKRHWGAYGNKPDDTPKPQRITEGPGNPQFNTVHGIGIAKDNTIYVADRANNRIQAFTPEGKFIKEAYNDRAAKGTGSAFGVTVSPDDRWLYIADAAHEHIAVMDRATMELVAPVGRPGTGAGEFTNLHSLAVDPDGNIITGESQGYRIQKFIYKGVSN